MEFRFHDIFSKIIPGGFFLTICGIFLVPTLVENEQLMKYVNILKEFDGLLTAFALILTYVIGYIIDGLGSIFLEELLWKIWGGWPVILLHKKKYTKRTTFPHSDLVFKKLSDDCLDGKNENFTIDEYDKLYYYAQNIVRKEGNDKQQERQEQYVEAYIFSRSILVATILSIIAISLLSFFQPNSYLFSGLLILVLILIFFYYRSLDKALYQTRDILNAAYTILNKKSNEVKNTEGVSKSDSDKKS